MDTPDIQLNVGALSETGPVRDENQDRMSGDIFPIGNLYIVADGMGGYEGGGQAAELAIQHLRDNIGKAGMNDCIENAFTNAFNKANQVIYDRNHSPGVQFNKMGTTAVALLLSKQVAKVAHVGDSRAYFFRNGFLCQITLDHTKVQSMIDAGVLSREEGECHPDSHILERAIGIHDEVTVDISNEIPFRDGDAFLLCSDGLSGYVSDTEIESVLKSRAAIQEIPKILVDKAIGNGGSDNITVQFIQYGTRRESIGDGNVEESGPRTRKIHKFIKYILVGVLFFGVLLFLIGYGSLK